MPTPLDYENARTRKAIRRLNRQIMFRIVGRIIALIFIFGGAYACYYAAEAIRRDR